MTTLLRRPLPLTVTNSEIQTFKSCRRKWYLAYYRELGLRRTEVPIVGARQLGLRVHTSLHAMYAEGANPVTVVRELYAEVERENPDIDAETLRKLRSEADLGSAMLEGYVMWISEEGIDEGLHLMAAETTLEVPSGIPNVRLRGRLDQRWQRDRDGARLFRDFKTVGDLSTPPMMLPLDEQMKFYHLLEYLDSIDKTGGEPAWRTTGGLYTMLRKVKRTARANPPFFMQLEVGHNSHELRSMWRRVHRVIAEILGAIRELDEDGDHHYICPPRPSRDCTWSCDYLPVCPMMDDGSNSEGLLAEYYTHVDPNARYEEDEERDRNFIGS